MQDQYDFRRSSFCGSGGCVEVAPLQDGLIAVRDSKDAGVQEHRYTPEEWVAFVQGVKAGEFDFGLPIRSPHRTHGPTPGRLDG